MKKLFFVTIIALTALFASCAKKSASQIENMFDYYVKNQTEAKVQFTAAHGYAFFSPSGKADFIQAQSMADKAMYENKILSKKGRS
ncbi:MAG: hypothetical protein J5817_09010 [Treponema sp.]|nr:hypothetical protein [Treponema sp.]